MINRLGCGIVTYNPDIKRLNQNISAIVSQVDTVLIFDNGSSNIADIKNLCQGLNTIKIIESECNVGISKALNKIMEVFDNSCFKWVLTLDQDSVSPSNLAKELSKYCDEKVGAIGPVIQDLNKKEISSFTENGIIERGRIITSGCLTNVDAWRIVGKFDEEMFIDGVDFDFCDRLRKAGYKVLEVQNVFLIHEIGHIETHRFVFWKIDVKNHGPFRKYYIAKNIIYLDWKNKRPMFPFISILRVLKQVALVILYETDKLEKLKAMNKGVIDAFRICSGVAR